MIFHWQIYKAVQLRRRLFDNEVIQYWQYRWHGSSSGSCVFSSLYWWFRQDNNASSLCVRFKNLKKIRNGVVTPVKVLNASFNADHRLIDGATMARFVQVWKQLLEKPASIALKLK